MSSSQRYGLPAHIIYYWVSVDTNKFIHEERARLPGVYTQSHCVTFLSLRIFLSTSIIADPNEDGINGIPEIAGYDNCTRILNHNITKTLEMEEMELNESYF